MPPPQLLLLLLLGVLIDVDTVVRQLVGQSVDCLAICMLISRRATALATIATMRATLIIHRRPATVIATALRLTRSLTVTTASHQLRRPYRPHNSYYQAFVPSF